MHSAIELKCIHRLSSFEASARYRVLRLKFPDRYLPWGAKIDIAAAITSERLEKSIFQRRCAICTNMLKNGQPRFI